LDVLESAYSIVSFEELKSNRAESGERLAVLTFDDAYRGTLTLGLSEIRARGLPGIVFVPPGLLGREGFWWDRLADPGEGCVPTDVRDHAFGTFKGLQDEILLETEFQGRERQAMSPLYQPVTEGELLEAMKSNPRVAFESHTWTHPHLPSLPEPEIRSQLVRSKGWLEKRGAGRAGLLSYPYGAMTDTVAGIAREVGFNAAFLVSGGRMNPSTLNSNALQLPRLNIPRGLSKEGFWMRASGAFGP
jgi:peptidoglycan/xylan/chitin deacetylase (PgdA/CDA1 family)